MKSRTGGRAQSRSASGSLLKTSILVPSLLAAFLISLAATPAGAASSPYSLLNPAAAAKRTKFSLTAAPKAQSYCPTCSLRASNAPMPITPNAAQNIAGIFAASRIAATGVIPVQQYQQSANPGFQVNWNGGSELPGAFKPTWQPGGNAEAGPNFVLPQWVVDATPGWDVL